MLSCPQCSIIDNAWTAYTHVGAAEKVVSRTYRRAFVLSPVYSGPFTWLYDCVHHGRSVLYLLTLLVLSALRAHGQTTECILNGKSHTCMYNPPIYTLYSQYLICVCTYIHGNEWNKQFIGPVVEEGLVPSPFTVQYAIIYWHCTANAYTVCTF